MFYGDNSSDSYPGANPGSGTWYVWYQPVHFGVIMCINLAIGCATPPLGLNLYVAVGLTKDRVEVVVNKHTLAYILVSIAMLFLITYIPDIVMVIPNSMM